MLFLISIIGFIFTMAIISTQNYDKIKQIGVHTCAPNLYIENENKSVCDKSSCQRLVSCFSSENNRQYFILENHSK